MRRRLTPLLFVFLYIACITTGPLYASAWVLPKGTGLNILTLRHYQTDIYYDLQGDRTPIPTYKKTELNPYMEYGLTERWTVGMNFSYQSVSQQPDPSLGLRFTLGDTTYTVTSDRQRNIGDFEVFARYLLWQGERTVLSIQPLVKAPSPEYQDRLPLIGTPFWDGEISLRLGHGFQAWEQNHFAEFHAGYRMRGEEPEDQLRFLARIGLRSSQDWLWMAELNHERRLGTGVRTNGLINFIQDYDLTKLQLSTAYDATDSITVQVGGFQHLHAENAGGGGGGLLSLWFKF